MRAASTVAVIAIILAAATGIYSAWLMNQRTMNVFDARMDGFNRGVAFARQQEEFSGKLGLCVYASLACNLTKAGQAHAGN